VTQAVPLAMEERVQIAWNVVKIFDITFQPSICAKNVPQDSFLTNSQANVKVVIKAVKHVKMEPLKAVQAAIRMEASLI